MESIVALFIPLFALAIGMVAVVSKLIVRPLLDAYLATHPITPSTPSTHELAALEERVAVLERQLLPTSDRRAA